MHNLSKDFVDSFFHDVEKEEVKIPLEEEKVEPGTRRKREDVKSTPKNEDFLPDFG